MVEVPRQQMLRRNRTEDYMIKLRKYQKKGVRIINKMGGRCLLADDMGLGKTLQSLTWMVKYDKVPAIVVCPATVKWTWAEEAREHYGLKSYICESRKPYIPFPKDYELIIINYDILPKWYKYLNRKIRAKVIILDECHYIKNPKASRTKAVKNLCDGKKHVIALSGTPMTNRPVELWVLLHLLRPDTFDNFRSFAMSYCKPKLTPWGWQYNGATRLKQLNRRLSVCMLRRRKEDVLKELPKKSTEIILLDIEKRRDYIQAKQDIVAWLKKISLTKGVKAARSPGLMRLGVLKRLAAELKMKSVFKWVEDYMSDTDDKLIIFCIHKNIVKQLKTKYKNKCVVIDGSVTGSKRKQAVHRFNNDNKVRLLIGNIQAAGVGLNLQKACHTVAFIEIGWTSAEMSQAEDRVYRMGQKHPVMIYYLIARDTIEHDLCSIVSTKQKTLEKTLDGKVVSKVQIYDKLSSLILKESRKKVFK